MKLRSIRASCAIAGILYSAAFPLHAADAPDAPRCRYVNLKSIPLVVSNERLNIGAEINDKPIKMFVDTGAVNTILTRDGAERLGLTLAHARPVGGVGGESRAYQARVDKFGIGPLEGKHMTLEIFWESSLDKDVDGLVGADFLFQQDLDLSIKDRQIKFMHPLNCKSSTNLAYWDHDASVVEMEEVQPESSANPGGDPGREVTVVINGQKVRAQIDTGAPYTTIDLAAAKRVGITPDSPGVVKLKGQGGGVGSQRRDVWQATFDTFALGDEVIPHAKVDITDLWGALKNDNPEWDDSTLPEMLLGMDFLKKHHVLFAVSQRKFYFSYLGGGLYESELSDVVSQFSPK